MLAVAALLSLTMAVAACLGLWTWSDIFPRKAYLSDVVRDCRKVRAGREAPCSNVFESACFDRSRCPRPDGGTSLSVYVHDDKCSMKSSSEIVANYRGGAVPKMWSQAAEALRQVAAARCLRSVFFVFFFRGNGGEACCSIAFGRFRFGYWLCCTFTVVDAARFCEVFFVAIGFDSSCVLPDGLP